MSYYYYQRRLRVRRRAKIMQPEFSTGFHLRCANKQACGLIESTEGERNEGLAACTRNKGGTKNFSPTIKPSECSSLSLSLPIFFCQAVPPVTNCVCPPIPNLSATMKRENKAVAASDGARRPKRAFQLAEAALAAAAEDIRLGRKTGRERA